MGGSVLEEVHSAYDVQLDDDGLLVLTLHRGLSVSAELAQQVVDRLFDLVGERRVVVLLRMAGVRWATAEVRWIAHTFTPSLAVAVVGNGPVDRVWGTFSCGFSPMTAVPGTSTTRPNADLAGSACPTPAHAGDRRERRLTANDGPVAGITAESVAHSGVPLMDPLLLHDRKNSMAETKNTISLAELLAEYDVAEHDHAAADRHSGMQHIHNHANGDIVWFPTWQKNRETTDWEDSVTEFTAELDAAAEGGADLSDEASGLLASRLQELAGSGCRRRGRQCVHSRQPGR